jgi:arylsulfatase
MIHGGGSYFDPVTLTDGNTRLPAPEGDYYFTDAISDYAAQYIREHDSDAPFFMYVAYTSPHWPLHAPEEDIARYSGRYDEGWDALRAERLDRMIDMDIIDPKWKLTERDTRVKPWEETEHKEWHARRMEVYAAQIDRMDQGIGRIVSALNETRQLANSLVLFLADNGGCAEEIRAKWDGLHIPRETRDGRNVRVGNDSNVMPGPEDTYQSYGVPWANASNTPFRLYKHFNHEGGISTPLIAHWPASITDHGALRRHPSHLIDLMATCVDLADADYPAEYKGEPIHPMEGTSLAPAFDAKPLEREALFWEHEGNRAIRVDDWKLVAKSAQGKWQLYNLAEDRSETNDLAAAHYDRVQHMAAQWEAWAERANVFPWPHKPYERK